MYVVNKISYLTINKRNLFLTIDENMFIDLFGPIVSINVKQYQEEIMLIETTVHMHKEILEILDRGAAMTGKSRAFIIKYLMQQMMNKNQKMLKTYSRIQYQKRDVKENWHRLHIIFNEYEYEYSLDMRKFYKMSFSLILAYAVRQYLDDVLCKLFDKIESTDKYLYRNYLFIKKTLNGVICWQIYWGIPLKYTVC